MRTPLIAIGTAGGGAHALATVLAGLPPDLRAAVCVVRIAPGSADRLREQLARVSTLPVHVAADGMPLLAGNVYLAPPDVHLGLRDADTLELDRGPHENFVRPAVDRLFRAAAQMYGRQAIGVLLTGDYGDGAAGLHEIRRRGGFAIVEDPASAECPAMPRGALDHVDVDHVVPLERIAACLESAVQERLADDVPSIDANIASIRELQSDLDRPVALSCGECGGAMRQIDVGSLVQFRCHIGHRASIEAIAAQQIPALERASGALLRLFNERVELCRIMRRHVASDPVAREAWDQALQMAQQRVEALLDLLREDWEQPRGTSAAPAMPLAAHGV